MKKPHKNQPRPVLESRPRVQTIPLRALHTVTGGAYSADGRSYVAGKFA